MGVQGRYNLDEAAYLRSQISGILSHDQNHFSAFDGSRASASATNLGYMARCTRAMTTVWLGTIRSRPSWGWRRYGHIDHPWRSITIAVPI
ncbi:hypothetical protein O0544_20485 [Edwardsiella anguillarum]|nr:hypothetical protein [Edwardsiella anguillarum]